MNQRVILLKMVDIFFIKSFGNKRWENYPKRKDERLLDAEKN